MKRVSSVRGRLSPRADLLIGTACIALLVAVWCGLTYGKFILPMYLPTPEKVLEGFADLNSRHWLFPAIGRSTGRVAQSLLMVVLIGAPIGVLMGAFPIIDAFLRKPVNAAKAVPPTGIIGLIILWIGLSEKGIVTFLFVGAVFYMIVLSKNAVQAVREDYVRVATDIGATPGQIVWKVLMPGALPQLWEGIAVCNGIMWTYIVLAEYLNNNLDELGLGSMLRQVGRTPGEVYAVLILIAIIAVGTDFILLQIKKRFLNW